MTNSLKTIFVLLTIFAVSSIGLANAAITTSSVTIGTTCGIVFVPTNATINYGQILPGDITAEQTFIVKNPGNVNATLKVSGTNWLDSTSANKMNVDNTKYSLTSGAYSAKTALNTVSTSIVSSFTPQVNTNTFWQLEANLIDTLFSGALTQTMSFSSSC